MYGNYHVTLRHVRGTTFPPQYSSYLHAYKDGTDIVIRNVDIQTTDDGESLMRKYTRFRTRRNVETDNNLNYFYNFRSYRAVNTFHHFINKLIVKVLLLVKSNTVFADVSFYLWLLNLHANTDDKAALSLPTCQLNMHHN
jgi:hypothetical protein